MSTNNPMTQERLDAIQERVDKATAGPWARWAGIDDRDNSVASDGREDAPTVADVIPEKDDAAFIAHARQDIPVLLAEVERLRALTTVDDAKIERVARNLANLEVGEAWPTTRELGGVPRSGRDEEYRSAMREWAQKVINISLGEDEDEWI